MTKTEAPVAPEEFLCPLTLDIMSDPVMSKYGQSFERSEILKWLSKSRDSRGVCPLSRRPLTLSDLVTNHGLKEKISAWRLVNGEHPEKDTHVLSSSEKVYGFITLPCDNEDRTDVTLMSDDEEDLLYLQLAALGFQQPQQQHPQQARTDTSSSRRRRRRHRPSRRNSTGSPSATTTTTTTTTNTTTATTRRTSQTRRRPLQGLRNFLGAGGSH